MLMFRFLQLEACKAELCKACLMAVKLRSDSNAEFNSCIVRKATFDQCNKFADHGFSRFSISENFCTKRLFLFVLELSGETKWN